MSKKRTKKKKQKRTLKSDKSDTIKKGQKRTAEKQKVFLQLYENKACNVSLTCKAIGISRETYYEWRKASKKFEKRCHEIEEGLIDFAESQLMLNIKAGKETSLIFFLCNRGKGRGWQSVQKIEHVTDPDNPPELVIRFDDGRYPEAGKEGKNK